MEKEILEAAENAAIDALRETKMKVSALEEGEVITVVVWPVWQWRFPCSALKPEGYARQRALCLLQ